MRTTRKLLGARARKAGSLAVAGALIALTSCGSSSESASSESPPPISYPTTALPYLRSATGPNVMSVTVGASGTLCGQSGYPNEPCTSVTVCMPGTSQCQTIPDILVDTGSVGLRIFASALPFSLPKQTDSSGNTIAQCAQFGTGSDWGPLASASVILANEPAVTLPIQIIDKSFAKVPSSCADADTDTKTAGFNGILGLGPFNEDCGTSCAQSTANRVFFSCDSSGNCTPIRLPNSQQPQNPVSLLPTDNNGVLLAFDQVPVGGASQVNGVVILGIGTAANNVPSGVLTYPLDGAGNFSTQFQGKTYSGSFIDSGSNGLYFPNTVNLPICPQSGNAPGFFCPTSVQTFSAINIGATGSPQGQVDFAIGNGEQIALSSNTVFVELGGDATGSFDWGLPFFYGRAVFEGIEGKSSPIGTGPFVAY